MGWGDFFGGNEKEKRELSWGQLTDLSQLDNILAGDNVRPQLIFKHSTRCSISSMALQRFEREWDATAQADIWYLDLLRYRDISNAIAARTGVSHQSPQAILVVKGISVYDASHSGISAQKVSERVSF